MKTLSVKNSFASLILLAAPSSAAPIMFENLDHAFAWTSSQDGECHACITGQWLNVTRSAADQTPASESPGSISRLIWTESMFPSDLWEEFRGSSAGTTGVARGPTYTFNDPVSHFVDQVLPVLQLHRGDAVGPTDFFGVYGRVFKRIVSSVFFDIPGNQFCFGVSFTLPDGVHYAWVQVSRTGLLTWTPDRWAYETEPNTPIVVPDIASPVVNPPPDSPTIFSNSSFDFLWTARDEQSGAGFPEQWLDVTLPTGAQTGLQTETALLYSHDRPALATVPKADKVKSALRLAVASAPPQTFTSASGTQMATVTPLLALSQAQTVGQALSFLPSADMFFRWPSEHIFQHLIPDRTFIAIRVSLNDGSHYGWVELVPRISATQPWAPLRWAYHPLPDLPIVLPALSPVQASPPFCPDLNNDHMINGADLGILLGSWGTFGAGDINGDGATDSLDLSLMLGGWGACS